MDFIEFQVKPLSYKLNLSEEQQKKLKPFFKVSSGASTRITKFVEHPQQNLEDKVEIKTKEKGTINIELYDSNSSKPENLIGKGEVKYTSLKSHEGTNEETVVLKNAKGQEVGKAIVQVICHAPEPNLSIEEEYRRGIDTFDRSFRRGLDSMDQLFEGFGRFALPSETFPSLTSGEGRKDMIAEEKTTQPSKGISLEKKKQPEMVSTKESNELTLKNRDLMAKTFADMQNSFEKTMEEMHNKFESLTREMFSQFNQFSGPSLQQGSQRREMDIESKSKETGLGEKVTLDQPKA